jgi:hypothetical protein
MQHGMRDGGWLTFAVDRKEAEKPVSLCAEARERRLGHLVRRLWR